MNYTRGTTRIDKTSNYIDVLSSLTLNARLRIALLRYNIICTFSSNLLQSVPFASFRGQRSQSVTLYSCRFHWQESLSWHFLEVYMILISIPRFFAVLRIAQAKNHCKYFLQNFCLSLKPLNLFCCIFLKFCLAHF